MFKTYIGPAKHKLADTLLLDCAIYRLAINNCGRDFGVEYLISRDRHDVLWQDNKVGRLSRNQRPECGLCEWWIGRVNGHSYWQQNIRAKAIVFKSDKYTSEGFLTSQTLLWEPNATIRF